MDLDSLLKVSGEYKPMVAGDYDLSKVYCFGEDVAKEVKMSPALDLHDLIRGNGGEIHYIDHACFRTLGDSAIIKNSIYVHSERNFDIILPAYASLVENRYTMAHELGHYVLHSKNDQCFAQRNGDGNIEKEANCFALGFLMPSESFKAAYEQCKNNPNELSIAFLVPLSAVNARINSLGLHQE
ncbi:MAG: ImmA/IrrE family metallo-endopeptidase [Planctomycetaceae bacterium]|jgi:Zn-dependent peptidase ImmA (M78 family)|nr:ImmA/IrrE family metallo-endopeptidase [Planctomycetaceae bacterium]